MGASSLLSMQTVGTPKGSHRLSRKTVLSANAYHDPGTHHAPLEERDYATDAT